MHRQPLPRRILRTCLGLAAMALLSGCLLVEDFGPTWEEAKADPCLSKLAESIYATEYRRDPSHLKMDDIAHGWTLDGHHYLLLKKAPEDKGGRLYAFKVVNGIFQRYRLDPTMRDTFEKEHPTAPISLKNDTVKLEALTPETKTLLTEIAGKPEYWQVEEQALYNVLRNPACRFDDRDLTQTEQ